MDFICFDAPIGFMALAAEGNALVRVYLPNTPVPRLMSRETPLLAKARTELLEYLNGERKTFDLPMKTEGTPFQERVWSALCRIPCGQVRTYQQIAEEAGSPRGALPVGSALSRNPLPILIPCHRVIASDGSLSGYAGGAELKRYLLALEGYVR